MEWSERIGRRIRLRDLHILLAVAQCKSMAKAAEQLAISKPAISKVVADLEHLLGVRLLERSRHGAEPTVYGTALLKRSIAVFDELRESVNDIAFLVDPAAGQVRIGSTPLVAASFVSALVDRLSQRYPRMGFALEVTDPDALNDELSERNVDLLVVQILGRVTDDIFSVEPLYDDLSVVVAGAHSPWARRRKITLRDLADEPWTLPPPQRAFGPVFEAAFRAAGLDYPRATVFTISPDARIGLVATGRFLSILPVSHLRLPRRRAEIKVLPVKLSVDRIPFGIVTLKNRTLSPAAQLFIEHARQVARPLRQ